jgi:surface antigen
MEKPHTYYIMNKLLDKYSKNKYVYYSCYWDNYEREKSLYEWYFGNDEWYFGNNWQYINKKRYYKVQTVE